MEFALRWTEEATAQYDELREAAERSLKNRHESGKKKASKQEGLFKQVQKCIKTLRTNPKHPSLNTHEYSRMTNPHDADEKVWEAYAQNNTPGAYRVFWCYGPGKEEITIVSITPHP